MQCWFVFIAFLDKISAKAKILIELIYALKLCCILSLNSWSSVLPYFKNNM